MVLVVLNIGGSSSTKFIREIDCEDMYQIELAQNSVQLWTDIGFFKSRAFLDQPSYLLLGEDPAAWCYLNHH
jgi:hypothetical protein